MWREHKIIGRRLDNFRVKVKVMYMACNISHITTRHERVLASAIVDALQSLKCSQLITKRW
jgi:hypothetical protein